MREAKTRWVLSENSTGMIVSSSSLSEGTVTLTAANGALRKPQGTDGTTAIAVPAGQVYSTDETGSRVGTPDVLPGHAAAKAFDGAGYGLLQPYLPSYFFRPSLMASSTVMSSTSAMDLPLNLISSVSRL